MTAKVSYDATAESPPCPPVRRQVTGVIRAFSGWSEPEVPGQGLGHRRLVCRPLLRSIAAIKPQVGFTDLANRAAPNQLDGATQAIFGAALVAHLGDDLVLERGLAHYSRFMHRAGEGLFTINMFAPLHRCHGGHGVRVVGRGDYHGIDLFVHLVQHPPKISEWFGLGMPLEDVARSFLVHVTQTNEVHTEAGNVVKVRSSLAANTDAGDIQLIVSVVSEREFGFGQEEQGRTAEGRSSKEAAARQESLHAAILASRR